MNCTFCEAPLPSGARYCSQCGTAVLGGPAPGGLEAEGKFWPEPVMMPPQGPRLSIPALISLIAGIGTWTFAFGIGWIVAIITGHMARKEIRESNGWLDGAAMANVGLALAYAQVALALIVLLVITIVLGVALVSHH